MDIWLEAVPFQHFRVVLSVLAGMFLMTSQQCSYLNSLKIFLSTTGLRPLMITGFGVHFCVFVLFWIH